MEQNNSKLMFIYRPTSCICCFISVASGDTCGLGLYITEQSINARMNVLYHECGKDTLFLGHDYLRSTKSMVKYVSTKTHLFVQIIGLGITFST